MTISNQSNANETNGDWAENTQETKIQRVVVAASNGGPSELLDMTALDKKRNEEDDIAERLRVEETKAQLAAAREGMEKKENDAKEAKLEANEKSISAPAAGGSRFGAAAANIADGDGAAGGKWIPRHMRNAPSSGRTGLGGSMGMGSRSMGMGMGGSGSSSGYQRKVDTNDENLFPDLATADKLIAEEEESKQMAARRAKASAPVWSTKPKAAPAKPAPPVEEKPAPIVEEKKEPPKETPAPTPAPTTTTTSSVAAGLKKKKKKKKDLSTFKA